MRVFFVSEIATLDALSVDHSQSPEEFLCWLEDQLDRGLITFDEARCLVADFQS